MPRPIHIDQHDPGLTAVHINARVYAWSLSVATAARVSHPLPPHVRSSAFPLYRRQLRRPFDFLDTTGTCCRVSEKTGCPTLSISSPGRLLSSRFRCKNRLLILRAGLQVKFWLAAVKCERFISGGPNEQRRWRRDPQHLFDQVG